jgi:hypothetical protein
VLGLYHTADGQRLNLLDGGGVAQGDSWELGRLVVLGQAE